MTKNTTRRDFIKALSTGALITTGSGQLKPFSEVIRSQRKIGPNDTIRVATIGMGIIAFYKMESLVQVPGVELVAVADCYDGRLTRARTVFGDHLETTKKYSELISRSDIDAIVLCVPDHWHSQMAVEALQAGKHVYVEKPIIQKIEDGHKIIQAQKASGKVVIVGSQSYRHPLHQKAKELIKQGAIGQLNVIEAEVSRNNGIGAWQYTIPSDASPKTIDWDSFLGPAPRRAFDADRFFRWRKFKDYGTGVSGDMFVHRLTALHYILDSTGPVQIAATGGLRYWNDGREAPDVLNALLEYPETASHPAFTLILKANFADGSGGGPSLKFIGSEGVIELRSNSLSLRSERRDEPSFEELLNGYNSARTFAEGQRTAFREEYFRYQSKQAEFDRYDFDKDLEYTAPQGYDADLDHFMRWTDAIRNEGAVYQNAVVGLRAAAPAIIPNYCLEGKVYTWNPKEMKMKPM